MRAGRSWVRRPKGSRMRVAGADCDAILPVGRCFEVGWLEALMAVLKRRALGEGYPAGTPTRLPRPMNVPRGQRSKARFLGYRRDLREERGDSP